MSDLTQSRPVTCVAVHWEKLMRFRVALLAGALVLTGLAACEHKPSKEEEEAVKNTFACQIAGQRMVIRFDTGEARLLTAAGEKVTLYQIASTTGVRYTNGSTELRGRGDDLTLIEYGVASKLDDCKPYAAPKP
jgi:membrane-bound inhibitor of C-type lysozyme